MANKAPFPAHPGRLDLKEEWFYPPTAPLGRRLFRRRLKHSKQRESILAAFAQEHIVTAPKLYLTLRGEGHRISLATIYRALHLFCKMGLAESLKQNQSQTRFRNISARTFLRQHSGEKLASLWNDR